VVEQFISIVKQCLIGRYTLMMCTAQ